MAQKRRRLAERRRLVGLSQEHLAEAVEVDRTTVVRWERGETVPVPRLRPRLAEALSVSLDELHRLLGAPSPREGQVSWCSKATDPGSVLRAVREDAGLSLGALARRVYFSKAYLSNLERGRRKVTPAVLRAYVDALGDDVHRRQLLLTLAAGATSGSSVLRHVFDSALQPVTLALDDWAAKVATYGRDYLALNPADLTGKLAGDLTLLQPRLDHPFLAAISSKLLTLHGLAVQNTCTTRRDEVVHWYRLGVLAADRSGDVGVRVWARGRAALALAYEGVVVDLAGALAEEALGLSEHESAGRISALLGLAHVRALAGDDDGARAALAEARRAFEAVGVDRQVDDFVMSEWRLEMIINLLGARLGDERLTLEAQERAECALPEVVQRFGLYMELHRALMLVRAGDRTGGVRQAEAALARNPTGGSSPHLLLDEIGMGVGQG